MEIPVEKSAQYARDLTGDTIHWRERLRGARSAGYKRLVYWIARPVLSAVTRRNLSDEAYRALSSLKLVLPERGFPLETRRAWAHRRARLRGATILVLGAGSGWEVTTWVDFQPRRIVAVDVYPYIGAWNEISAAFPDVGFALGKNETLPLRSQSIDFIASDAVLEHCKHMPAVAAEASRVLKCGGYLYAGYGPMWFCFGGDHFSGRGGLTYGYSHVELTPEEYLRYFESHKLPVEDAQSGGRYVELGLFSKWTTRQYLECFENAGFEIVDAIFEVCGDALAFRRKWPDRFECIARRNRICHDDLLIKSNLVLLRKAR